MLKKTHVKIKNFDSREEAQNFIKDNFLNSYRIMEDNSVQYSELTKDGKVIESVDELNIIKQKEEKKKEIFEKMSLTDQLNLARRVIVDIINVMPATQKAKLDAELMEQVTAGNAFIEEVINRPIEEETLEAQE